MGLFKKIKDGLKKTRDSVVGQIDSMLKSFTKIDEELFEKCKKTVNFAPWGSKPVDVRSVLYYNIG